MRFTNRRLSLVVWAVVTGAFAILLLDGCSEPKSTTRSGSGPTAAQTTSPVPQTIPANGGTSVVDGVNAPSAVALPPTDPAELGAAWQEGVRLFEAKDYAAAAGRLQVAVTGKQDDAYAHYLLGLALFKSGQLDRAEEALTESARLGPASVKTWVNLARVRLDRGDAGGALEAADSALEIDGIHADALHQKGRSQAALGRRDEALETLRLAHDTDPGNGQIANTLGYWLIQSGRPGEAVEFLEAARDRLPQTAYVRNNLAVAYERTGRTEEALAEYRAAVDCGDSGGRAASSLARLNAPLSDSVVASHSSGPHADPVAEASANPDPH